MAANYSCILSSSSEEEEEDGDIYRHSSFHPFDSYSISADVSESESCSSASTFSSRPPPPPQAAASHALNSLSSSSDSPARPKVMFPVVGHRHVVIPEEKQDEPELSEVELIKERFAKLLLGEDMSGGGNGVCTALAISKAITNLAATVFGELWKLEPMVPKKKSMWLCEMEWLLCVSDSIVELVPSVQELPCGRTVEVMVPQPRSDLSLNLPALKNLDAMLISILDGFHDSEFYYVDRGIIFADGEFIEARPCPPSQERPSITLEEKWWLPFPKVPQNGLCEETRKQLQQCRECTNQIYRAAVAINNRVLSEMEVPQVYLDSLPKSGKACLGEILYRYITALHIWRQKYSKKKFSHTKTGKSQWSGPLKVFVDIEKAKMSAQRADSLLKILKLHFPTLPQTALERHKIQYNKDVGQSILESYSRVIEGLAFNLMARIEDLLYVDEATRLRAAAESLSFVDHRGLTGDFTMQKQFPSGPVSTQLNSCASLLRKPAFCSGVPLVRKLKRIQKSQKNTPDEKIERALLEVYGFKPPLA
ncbi:rop guanine nucleotide exchange factor 1-like isoform X2 [Coffea eugenioides]|uniref:Rop guanine nucleotide exchange factor 1-like isoform X3 n=1 Tax=Coffea arabica TaxID=13443 RepID=A0ABM4W2F5_COFAR|nr:rop guanine nucleotide exchange factor 1-like isoform X2 [Coffea eugenioides]